MRNFGLQKQPKIMYSELKKIIEQAWENRELLSEEPVRQAVRQVVELVDKGQLRRLSLTRSKSSSLYFSKRRV